MTGLHTSPARPPRRSGAWRGLVAATATALMLTGGLLTSPAAHAGTTSAATGSTAAERGFVASINASRRAAGRHDLTSAPALTAVARAWARSMARSSHLAHNPRVWTQVRGWRHLGENVGVGGSTSSLHTAFMDSAPHRANIVSTNYTRVGIGVAYGGGRLWVVEVFERPFGAGSPDSAISQAAPGYGSRGALVRAAQRRLHVRPTGYFGKVTLARVRTFQRTHHLRLTGRLDPPTRRALHI